MVTLLMAVLFTSQSLSVGPIALHGLDALRFGALWAVAMLGFGFFEECSTRGYLQVALARSLGFWPAAVLLSCLFALENQGSPQHRNVLGFANSIIYGLLFCLSLRRTGNLWFAAGLHTALSWGLVFIYGMPTWIAGIHPPGALLQPVVHGPNWLTGGRYGPDGSVLTLALIAMLWVGLHFRFPEARYPR